MNHKLRSAKWSSICFSAESLALSRLHLHCPNICIRTIMVLPYILNDIHTGYHRKAAHAVCRAAVSCDSRVVWRWTMLFYASLTDYSHNLGAFLKLFKLSNDFWYHPIECGNRETNACLWLSQNLIFFWVLNLKLTATAARTSAASDFQGDSLASYAVINTRPIDFGSAKLRRGCTYCLSDDLFILRSDDRTSSRLSRLLI